jgi:hypothetical protein
MPNYKDPSVFNQRINDGNFDTIHLPGQITPFSGIYKCVNCGFEVVSESGKPFPPQFSCANHSHRWPNQYGQVRWRLVAAAIHILNNA